MLSKLQVSLNACGRLVGALVIFSLGTAQAAAEPRTAALRAQLYNPTAGVIVVAHRGCHNAAPIRNLPSAPENSLLSLDHCVRLGVHMAEIDIRRTKDGALVIIHDETVDRTTDGKGRVDELTLAEIKRLRLRANEGGQTAPTITDERVPTLAEMLVRAKGRILINLDIKGPIYQQVIDEVRSAGLVDEVLVKAQANPDSPVLADTAPYDATPFMPIIRSPEGSAPGALAAITARQLTAKRRPPGVEVVFLDPPEFAAVGKAVRNANVRLWVNTLTQGGVTGLTTLGGDLDALRDGGITWGTLIGKGVSMIQSDEPAYLLAYLKRLEGQKMVSRRVSRTRRKR